MPSDQKHTSDINDSSEASPSRPGPITTAVFVTLIGGTLLYMNWNSAKGLFGFD